MLRHKRLVGGRIGGHLIGGCRMSQHGVGWCRVGGRRVGGCRVGGHRVGGCRMGGCRMGGRMDTQGRLRILLIIVFQGRREVIGGEDSRVPSPFSSLNFLVKKSKLCSKVVLHVGCNEENAAIARVRKLKSHVTHLF